MEALADERQQKDCCLMETNWVDNTAVSCHGYVFIY